MTTQPDPPTAIDADFTTLILRHRKSSEELGRVMMMNARRGGEQSAADEINRAGFAMANTERDLMDAIDASRLTTARPERAEIETAIQDAWDDTSLMSDDNCIEIIADRVMAVIDKAAGGEG